MHGRRLATLALLACLAAAQEALLNHADPAVGFQAWMVTQLLGVIAAAIAVAAAFSVLGLATVRLAIAPWRDRPATFVGWSFLKAQVQRDPLPARLWAGLQAAVDAHIASPPQGPRARRVAAAVVIAALAAGLGSQALARQLELGSLALPWLVVRNLSVALGVHGLLLIAALPRARRLRLVLPVLVLIAVAVGLAIGLMHPLVAPWVHGPGFVGALVGCGALAVWRAGSRHGRAARLSVVGGWLCLVGGAGLAGALAGLGELSAGGLQPLPRVLGSVALAVLPCGVYLAAQRVPRVTLPVFVSIVGVASGTWALIVVLSVMGGFAEDLRAKMLVANAHAIVERPGRAESFARPGQLARALRAVPGVAGASPQMRGDAILSSAFNVNNFVSVRGIDASLGEVERELGSTLTSGGLALLVHPERMAPVHQLRPMPNHPGDLPPTGASGPDAWPGADARPPRDAAVDALLQLAPGPSSPPLPMIAPTSDGEHLHIGDVETPPQPPVAPGLPPLPTPRAGTEDDAAPLADALTGALAPLDEPPDPLSGGAIGDLLDPDPRVAPGVLLGAELARSLQVELGDRVELVTPDADVGPMGLRPRVRTFRVAGTFETGLYEADSKVAYVTLTEAARFFNAPGRANVIEVRLDEPREPEAARAAMVDALQRAGAPTDTRVLDWRALNRSLFSALAFERLVIFLVLALIILVASFAIISALTMVILQKRNGIAMLRAMGSSAKTVRGAFVLMGGAIGLIGTVAGLVLGLGTCGLVAALGIQLPDAYYIRELPVAVSPLEVGGVVVAALVISLIATVFPARNAARLDPLEGLRYE